ncbi:MAG: hypothetical protein EBY32_01870 [Proteobacteria bacterium]|nr:hypothetical protein [Pseudomonadota bacterium]
MSMGWTDPTHGFFRQDGRINRSQEGINSQECCLSDKQVPSYFLLRPNITLRNTEVTANIISDLGGMASVPSHTHSHNLPLLKPHFILMDILMKFL